MQADDVGEERTGHRSRRVRMPQQDEMGELGELIHHRQDDGLAIDVGKSFNEVHGNVYPYRRRYFKRLQQAAWTELFHLVLLADDISADVVMDDHACTGQEEVVSQTMQTLHHPFVCDVVRHVQHRRQA
jgi:hypothetical protein